MKVIFEHRSKFDAATPESLVAFIVFLNGHERLQRLSDDAKYLFFNLERDERLLCKTRRKRDHFKRIHIDFLTISTRCLVPAAVTAHRVFRQAAQISGSSAHVNRFSEDCSLEFFTAKKYAEEIAEKAASSGGVETVMVSPTLVFDASTVRGPFVYSRIDPLRSFIEFGQTALARLYETNSFYGTTTERPANFNLIELTAEFSAGRFRDRLIKLTQ
jgi:hypothetical protein